MRIVIITICTIVIGLIGYLAYGFLTFEPKRIAPLVFEEPQIPDSLLVRPLQAQQTDPSQALDPNNPNATPTAQAPTPELNEEQLKKAAQAVEQIGAALSAYQSLLQALPKQATPTVSTILATMVTNQIPAFLLTATNAQTPNRLYQNMKIEFDRVQITDANQGLALTCNTQEVGILIGDDRSNSINCPTSFPLSSSDALYISGPGNDTITAATGNKIINAGSGDDKINIGAGRAIIVLEDSWGKDTLTIDCAGSKVALNEIPQDIAVPWINPFTNFIVLSPRINQASVVWKDKVLTNLATGDTLTVNENCFNLVSANQ
jgi:hypothetical protein